MQSINATIKNNVTIINTTIKKCDNKKTQQNKMQSIKHNNKHATIHTSITKCNSNKHNNWCVITIDVADNKTKCNNKPQP